MARSWLAQVPEEVEVDVGEQEIDVDGENGTDLASSKLPVVVDLPQTLNPRHYMIVAKLFEGKKASQIAKELGMATGSVQNILARDDIKALVVQIEGGIVNRVVEGEFGALAIAKAHAIVAMRKLVSLVTTAVDERVQLNAALRVIELAGVRAPAPIVIDKPLTLFDEMTADEQQHFIDTGEFPVRLGSKLARVGAAALQNVEEQTWGVTVTPEPVNPQPEPDDPRPATEAPQRRPPRERIREREWQGTSEADEDDDG